MKASDILFCILNYKHSENAIKWYESLKNNFAVSILDTYVLDNPDSNDPLLNFNGNVLFYHNIFLGGVTYEAFKICIGGGFKFLCIITSDVEIDDKNIVQLKERFQNLPDDIGIYEVSADADSCVMGVVGQIEYTKRYFIKSEQDFKEDGLAEGWLYGINVECIKHLLPFINIKNHKHAWGVGGALLNISKSKGYRNVIDSKVFVHHPKGTGYSSYEAKNEWYVFDRLSEKIGIPDSFITIGYCAKSPNNDYKKYLISYFSDAVIIIEKICDTDNKKEVIKAYNEIIKESVTNGIILLQENTRFIFEIPDICIGLFQKILFKNKEFGIIGTAAKYINGNNIVIRSKEPVFCFNEYNDNGDIVSYRSKRGKTYSDEVFEDVVVDGRFLAIRKDRIKYLFNTEENLPYDTEFCISNYLNGVKIGVTKVISPLFEDKAENDEKEINNLLEKYKNTLPLSI